MAFSLVNFPLWYLEIFTVCGRVLPLKYPEVTYEMTAPGFLARTLGEVLKCIHYEGFIN